MNRTRLLFIGILGEYIGSIHTLVQKRPLALENERINFEFPPSVPIDEPIRQQDYAPPGMAKH